MGMFFLACGSSSSGGAKADSNSTTTATDNGATTATDGGATTATDGGATTATDGGATTATDGGATDEGATTATDGGTTDGGTTDAGTDGLPTTDGGTTGGTTDGGTTTGGSTTGGASACYNQAGQACMQCLAQENQTGAQAYINGLMANCICANECQSSCTATCANPQNAQEPGCDQCLQGLGQTSACNSAFSAACTQDANCVEFANAILNCQ